MTEERFAELWRKNTDASRREAILGLRKDLEATGLHPTQAIVRTANLVRKIEKEEQRNRGGFRHVMPIPPHDDDMG